MKHSSYSKMLKECNCVQKPFPLSSLCSNVRTTTYMMMCPAGNNRKKVTASRALRFCSEKLQGRKGLPHPLPPDSMMGPRTPPVFCSFPQIVILPSPRGAFAQRLRAHPFSPYFREHLYQFHPRYPSPRNLPMVLGVRWPLHIFAPNQPLFFPPSHPRRNFHPPPSPPFRPAAVAVAQGSHLPSVRQQGPRHSPLPARGTGRRRQDRPHQRSVPLHPAGSL